MATPLRLITPEASRATALMQTAIVVVTEPDLFKSLAIPTEAGQVFVVDNSDDVFKLLAKCNCTRMFADFRSLSDGGTGQKFLRQIKGTPGGDGIEFWLLANEWHPHQEVWAKKCGAKGFVHRSPASVATLISGIPPIKDMPSTLEESLDHIDTVFRRFAGPMATALHTAAARSLLSSGELEPSAQAYSLELSVRLTMLPRRREFLEAIQR